MLCAPRELVNDSLGLKAAPRLSIVSGPSLNVEPLKVCSAIAPSWARISAFSFSPYFPNVTAIRLPFLLIAKARVAP